MTAPDSVNFLGSQVLYQAAQAQEDKPKAKKIKVYAVQQSQQEPSKLAARNSRKSLNNCLSIRCSDMNSSCSSQVPTRVLKHGVLRNLTRRA